jgi:mannose-6-phosphate isomerase-like protein (cupin superfamily)
MRFGWNIGRNASVLALVFPLAAVAPPGFHCWKAADLGGIEQKLGAKHQALAGAPLADYGNHNLALTVRTASGQAELHENWSDVFVVRSGNATLIAGGEIVNPKTASAGEIRGDSIEGGAKQALSPGDIVHIPPKTPHQVLIGQGETFSYFIVKVAAQ